MLYTDPSPILNTTDVTRPATWALNQIPAEKLDDVENVLGDVSVVLAERSISTKLELMIFANGSTSSAIGTAVPGDAQSDKSRSSDEKYETNVQSSSSDHRAVGCSEYTFSAYRFEGLAN